MLGEEYCLAGIWNCLVGGQVLCISSCLVVVSGRLVGMID